MDAIQSIPDSLSLISRSGSWVARSGSGTEVQVEESIQHTREVLVDAFERKQLGFGFSAGGLLFSYYVGLAEELEALGIIDRQTPLAGSSAGSLIAATYNAGLDMEIVYQSCLELAEDCRKEGTRQRLGVVLNKVLQDNLPEDAHAQCTGVTNVGVTFLSPRPRSQLISEFESREDLIQCLLTSCHIPGYSEPRIFTKLRGRSAMDGGITNFMPIPPTEVQVTASCFPASSLGRLTNKIIISPDLGDGWDLPFREILKNAFVPGSEEFLSELRDKGRTDAAQWAAQTGLLDHVMKTRMQQAKQMAEVTTTAQPFSPN